MTLVNFFGLFGLAGIGLALTILGVLSKRLGEATRAPRRYVGFFIAAELVFLSGAAQFLNLLFKLATPDDLARSFFWVLLYNGLPALGVSIGLYFAWHYWSWLLAERD